MINDRESTISVKVCNMFGEVSTMLVDSGAQMSFLRADKIKNKNLINQNRIIKISGAVAGARVCTVGDMEGGIIINKVKYVADFQVVDKMINLRTDGVIGHDFLTKFNCKIDYENNTLDILSPITKENISNSIPENRDCHIVTDINKIEEKLEKLSKSMDEFNNKMHKNVSVRNVIMAKESQIRRSDDEYEVSLSNLFFEKDLPNKIERLGEPRVTSKILPIEFRRLDFDAEIELKARTQNIIEYKYDHDDEIMVEKSQIQEGVWIGNSISKPENGYIKLAIINANTNDVFLKKESLEINFFRLNEFEKIQYETRSHEPIEERLKILKGLIDLDHCNNEEKNKIWDTCKEFNDVFHIKGDKLSSTNAATHKIILQPGTLPINTKPYRLPYAQKEELESQVKKLLDDGVIQPSISPWCSPVLLVPKKPDETGKRPWRLCIDFRNVNNKTISDAYPLPNITEILDKLGNSKYYTSLDLERGYWQVEMDPNHREITAFKANGKFYEWRRMPMGLKNAAASFQRMMNNVLIGLQEEICLVYIDDLVIFSKDINQHVLRLRRVLEVIQKWKLKIKPEKCSFLRKEINFLGHIVSAAGILPDKRKIEAVMKFPIPKTQRQIKSWLGLCSYYRKFVENFAQIVKPINRLLKKDIKYEWNEECQKAFDLMKVKLTTPPLLIYPDFEKDFIIRTDSSDYGCGAILSQGKIREDLPICYMSKTFNKHQIKYNTTQKELLAIIEALRYFRPYVYLRKATIITDHQALVWIMSCKNPSPRVMRWKIELSSYSFDIIHRPGLLNESADALSRIQIDPEDFIGMEPIPNKVELKFPEEKRVDLNAITRSKNQANIGKNIPTNKIPERDLNNLNIKEEDIINFKKKKSMLEINIVTQRNDTIDSRVNFPEIFQDIEGRIHDLGKKRRVIYISKNLSDEILIKTITEIKRQLEIEGKNELAIIITKSDLKHYTKIYFAFAQEFKNTKTEITIFSDKIITLKDKVDQDTIMKNFHDNILGGHLGIHATINNIQKQYFWPNMAKDIKNYVNNCLKCKQNKIITHTKIPMGIGTTSSRAYQKVVMDAMGPIPESHSGNKYIVTFQDELTKYADCVAVPDIKAYTVAKAFVETIVCKHALPETLLTDNATDFVGKMFQEMCKILGVDHITTTVYHQQANGQSERHHRSLSQYLRIYTEKDLNNWDTWIPYALFTYNATKHCTTKMSPHYLLYGFEVEIPTNLKHSPTPIYNYEDYVLVLKNRLRSAHTIARENIILKKEKNKKLYDKTHNTVDKFKIGDSVIIVNERKKHKFDNVYKGPYKIIEIPSKENCLINIDGQPKLLHKNKLKIANINQSIEE